MEYIVRIIIGCCIPLRTVHTHWIFSSKHVRIACMALLHCSIYLFSRLKVDDLKVNLDKRVHHVWDHYFGRENRYQLHFDLCILINYYAHWYEESAAGHFETVQWHRERTTKNSWSETCIHPAHRHIVIQKQVYTTYIFSWRIGCRIIVNNVTRARLWL